MIVTRRTRYIAALLMVLLVVAGYRAMHLFFPNLWLPKTAEALQTDSQQRVNPHIYDSQWFDAARAGRTDITDALLKAGFPVNARTGSGYTALVLATYHGDLNEVNLLLTAGADPCIPDQSGNTALMGALFKGEIHVARRLLDLCPIDAANDNGQTALSFAALFGRLDMLAQLVQLGADPGHRDKKGNSAKMIVQMQGNDAAVAALEAVGARN
ncbi:ankyrin repeat domain-containing protein [Pseudomonas agarici]|nr:ankyrin repeat domain-containing protein [Pseudomonas agarici]